MGDWTGTVPSFPVGNLRSADMTTLADIDTALVTGWTSYTPTWRSSGTQPALLNGTLTGLYRRLGKTVEAKINFVVGSSSTFGTGTYWFDLPFTSARETVGIARALDTSAGQFYTAGAMVSALGGLGGLAMVTPVTTSSNAVWTSAAPMTWATGDSAAFHVVIDTA